MNYRTVFHQFGLLLVVLGGLMLLLAGGGFGVLTWLHQDYDVHARNGLLIAAVTGLVVGGLSWVFTRKGSTFLGRREALLLVSISWLLGAALAAMPLLHWARTSPIVASDHPFQSFWACYFEAMSGLTTTGATVLTDIESLPNSLLLWRAVLHWVGGLGIVVLFVAVLPSLGVAGKRMFKSETTGPTKGGVRPQVRETARMLWIIYVGITLLEIILLKLAGMTLFDAICHSFATVATGGFGTKNTSIAWYNSVWIDVIITIFIFLAGVNFANYDRLIRGRWRNVLRDPELRLYTILVVCAVAIITVSLMMRGEPIQQVGGTEHELHLGNAIRDAAFTTTAIHTSTGFSTADYDTWPFIAKATLLFLMFVGGCAGSTGSGLKVIRLWIVVKVLHREFERIFRPQIVRPVRMGREGSVSLDEDVKLATLAFALTYTVVLAFGAVAIMLLEQSAGTVGPGGAEVTFITAASASLSTLANIGPGIELVGPSSNFGWFSTPSLILMSLLMALGRLEMFAIIVLFMPRFWRGTS